MTITRKEIIIIGAGGHAAVIIEALQSTNDFGIVGLIDTNPLSNDVLGYSVLGNDADLARLRRQGVTHAVVGVGANELRQNIANHLTALGFELPTIVHRSALISPSAALAEGVVIMARATVGTRTKIGRCAIVNTGAVIDHDGNLGEAAHVAPLVAIAGSVTIGNRTLVGVGACVKPGIIIGRDVVIGAGSAVITDVPDGAVVGGTPARALAARRLA